MGDLSKEYDSFLTFSKLMIVYVNFLFISEILSGILIILIVIYQNLSRLIVVVSSILLLFLIFLMNIHLCTVS